MSWLDVVLPFTWWQRVLIVLVVLVFAPLLVAAGRLALAGMRLGAESVRVILRRLLRLPSPSRALVDSLGRAMSDVVADYAARLESGSVIVPGEYLARCRALVRRGLSRDLADRLAETADAKLLRELEACTDAELEHLSRVAAFTDQHATHQLLPWQWVALVKVMRRSR